MRAGVSLLLRQIGGPDGGEDEDAGSVPESVGAARDLETALMLAEGRWAAVGGEQQAMRPDLPAEHYSELLWTAAACLAVAAERSGLLDEETVLKAVERTGRSLLAAHNETVGPIAIVDRMVRLMGEDADSPGLLGRALVKRQFLLFAALAGRHVQIETAVLIDLLLTGPIEQIAALCRALGGSDPDYRHLLMALRPVRHSLTDVAIIAEADRYRTLDDERADAIVAGLRAPGALRAKLDHLRGVSTR
jgi:hypothetical protein